MPHQERVGSSNAVRLALSIFGLHPWGFGSGLDRNYCLTNAISLVAATHLVLAHTPK